MNTTDYVSYPIALALKKHGFDWECHYHYDSDRGAHIIEPNYTANDGEDCQYITSDDLLEDNNGWQYCSAPSLAQAQKWLRDRCGIHINVCIYSDYSTDADGKVCDRWDFWGFDLYAVSGGEMMEDGDGEYDSYEQALSAGIAAALELIGEKGE